MYYDTNLSSSWCCSDATLPCLEFDMNLKQSVLWSWSIALDRFYRSEFNY